MELKIPMNSARLVTVIKFEVDLDEGEALRDISDDITHALDTLRDQGCAEIIEQYITTEETG